MKTGVFVFLIVLGVAIFVAPAVVAQTNDMTIVRPVINDQGCVSLGLTESQITDSRKELPKRYGTASVPVHVTVLKPKHEFITTIPLYRLKDGNILVLAERKGVDPVDNQMRCE